MLEQIQEQEKTLHEYSGKYQKGKIDAAFTLPGFSSPV